MGGIMKVRLEGKIALVTGASRGIGEAIAKRLGETGATVLCAARTLAKVTEVAEAIKAAGGNAAPVELDITAADVRDKIKALIEQHGQIDVLVNNAGITDDDLFIRMKPEAWDRVIRTNLDSMFHITQEVTKKMIRTKWGRVINITSVVGLMGNPGQVNYAASKAGIIGFTKALAHEVGSRNVTVNAVAPGFIKTDMTDAMTEEARATLESRIATRRLGAPDDIAHAVVYLASEEASYITGTVLSVNGGLYM
jgi:3-oxoacyl-[acyl-carrier protein] reductase